MIKHMITNNSRYLVTRKGEDIIIIIIQLEKQKANYIIIIIIINITYRQHPSTQNTYIIYSE